MSTVVHCEKFVEQLSAKLRIDEIYDKSNYIITIVLNFFLNITYEIFKFIFHICWMEWKILSNSYLVLKIYTLRLVDYHILIKSYIHFCCTMDSPWCKKLSTNLEVCILEYDYSFRYSNEFIFKIDYQNNNTYICWCNYDSMFSFSIVISTNIA